MATSGRWKGIFIEGFEGGFGKFKDGGTDATIFTRLGYGRTKQSLLLQDNMKSSKAVLRDAVNIASYSELKLSFYFGRTVFARAKSSLLLFASTEASGSHGRHFRKEIHSTAMANGTWEKHP